MRDWNGDGIPDAIPDDWQRYTGGGCGCLAAIVVVILAVILLNA